MTLPTAGPRRLGRPTLASEPRRQLQQPRAVRKLNAAPLVNLTCSMLSRAEPGEVDSVSGEGKNALYRDLGSFASCHDQYDNLRRMHEMHDT